MTIHLRRVPASYDAALQIIRKETTTRLRNELAEERQDSHMPRHFKAREQFRKTGETA